MSDDEIIAGRAAARQAWFQRFAEQGEQEVRDALTNRAMSGNKAVWAQRWLTSLDDARSAAKESRMDSISEEHLRLVSAANDHADQANAIAKRANTIAAMAMITAVIAIAVSIITAFYSS